MDVIFKLCSSNGKKQQATSLSANELKEGPSRRIRNENEHFEAETVSVHAMIQNEQRSKAFKKLSSPIYACGAYPAKSACHMLSHPPIDCRSFCMPLCLHSIHLHAAFCACRFLCLPICFACDYLSLPLFYRRAFCLPLSYRLLITLSACRFLYLPAACSACCFLFACCSM